MNSFRRYIGVVSQQSYLFNDTIRNNLLYGIDMLEQMDEAQVAAKEQEMKLLCERLGLSNIINSLPEGYDTNLGDQAGSIAIFIFI